MGSTFTLQLTSLLTATFTILVLIAAIVLVLLNCRGITRTLGVSGFALALLSVVVGIVTPILADGLDGVVVQIVVRTALDASAFGLLLSALLSTRRPVPPTRH